VNLQQEGTWRLGSVQRWEREDSRRCHLENSRFQRTSYCWSSSYLQHHASRPWLLLPLCCVRKQLREFNSDFE
jgi:hypothetical protein